MNLQVQSNVREASVFDYLRVVVRHWWLILLICIPAVAIATVWSLVATETYQATTSIVPPLESLQGADMGLARGLLGGMEGAFLRNALNVTNVADIYVGILESRAVADAIVDGFDLMQVYGFQTYRWRALRHLRARTEIKVTKEGIVRIAVVDEDPTRAAAMANAYVAELDLQNKRLSSGRATGKRVFLENRLKEIEDKFRRIDSTPSHEAQIQEVLYELLIRECELAKIEEARSMPTIQVLDEAVPPEQKYEPVRRQIVMKAAVGSFALAVFLAFLREYRERMKREDEMERSWCTARPATTIPEEADPCDTAEEVVTGPGRWADGG